MVEAITEAGPITGAARFMPAVTTAVAMRWRDAAMDIHPVARTAVRRGVYRGAAYGAAAGAAAAGAYGYYNGGYNNGCYQNPTAPGSARGNIPIEHRTTRVHGGWPRCLPR